MSFTKSVLLSLLAASGFVAASPVAVAGTVAPQYDVIVVGGGPAGLSALSGLVRVRRNVLLIDSGEYRNGPTRHMHDVIGNDGTKPDVFRYNARQQIAKYSTAHMKNGTITSIRATGNANSTSFIATDSTGEQYTSRKIVLGTGMHDVLPTTPGVADYFGKGIYWCPWCDGYEHRDQPFGILGPLTDVIGSLLEVETLNTDIIAFVNGTDTQASYDTLDKERPGWRKIIAGYGAEIQNGTIERIVRLQDGAVAKNTSTGGADGTEYDFFRVDMTNGDQFNRSAFITNFPAVQTSNVGRAMGVTIKTAGDKMAVDQSSMRTNIPGVYAVGDANDDGSTNVVHAMYSGKKAAVYIHVELEKETAAAFVTKRDVDVDMGEEEVMQLMGRDVEELWSDASSE